MLINLNTTTDQQASASGQGNYLFVKSATGPVRFTVWLKNGRSQDVELRARNQIRFDDDIESLDLLNLYAGANEVEFETGLGEFLPDMDGQRVTLTGQDLSIEVQTQPGAPLEMESTDAKPVRIINKTGTQIAVSGPVTDAEMRAAPVPVSGPATDAEMRAAPLDVQPVVYPTATPGAEITGSGVIAANASRRFLHLLTDAANTGFFWTGGAAGLGLKIGANREIVLETSAGLTLTATIPGDKITFLEIEA